MQETPDILKRILERKAEEVLERKTTLSLENMVKRAADTSPPRSFLSASSATIESGKPAVIAEMMSADDPGGRLRELFSL